MKTEENLLFRATNKILREKIKFECKIKNKGKKVKVAFIGATNEMLGS